MVQFPPIGAPSDERFARFRTSLKMRPLDSRRKLIAAHLALANLLRRALRGAKASFRHAKRNVSHGALSL